MSLSIKPSYRSAVVVFLLTLPITPLLPAIAASDRNRPKPTRSTTISDSAFTLLTERITANRRNFYIFKDADSGFNHGFLSGVFASDTRAIRKIHIDANCINNEPGPAPCGKDTKRFDRKRVTVLKIAFDSLQKDEFAGLNIQEPEGVKSIANSVGYDLRGSTNVLFDARSPDGIRVQFGVGGGVTDFFTVAKQWTPISIPLNSLRPTPDFSKVHTLFSVSTNALNSPRGGTLLLDNIRLDPVPASQRSALAFPVSTESFGESYSQAVTRPEKLPSNLMLNNLATTYESALAVLALLSRETEEDQNNARRLLDTFHYALKHDNSVDPLPGFTNGALGLRDGYSNGDIALLNDQGPGGARSGDVRLAGLSSELCKPSGYCLVMDGATGGNMAFAMLALLAGYEQFDDNKYLNDARTLGLWIVNYLLDPSKSGYGGYFLGYADSSENTKSRWLKGKSVENNADIFAAFNHLTAIERWRGKTKSASLWTKRAYIAGDFVLTMFDVETGGFYAGTVPAESQPGAGIEAAPKSKKGNDVINKYRFIDANIFPVLALAEAPRYRKVIDWRRPIRLVAERFTRDIKVGDEEFSGFGIEEKTRVGADGITWEFTAQAVKAMRLADRLYGKNRFGDKAAHYMASMKKVQSIGPYGDKKGLVASTLVDGNELDPSRQCLMTPFQCIPQRVGLAATTWAIFAELNVNPLYSSGKTKANSQY